MTALIEGVVSDLQQYMGDWLRRTLEILQRRSEGRRRPDGKFDPPPQTHQIVALAGAAPCDEQCGDLWEDRLVIRWITAYEASSGRGSLSSGCSRRTKVSRRRALKQNRYNSLSNTT